MCFNAMCWRYMCACFRLYDGRCWSLLLLAFFACRALAPFAVKRVGLIAFVSSRGVCLLAFVSSLGLGCVSSLLAFCGCRFSSCPSCVMRVGAGVRAALSRRGSVLVPVGLCLLTLAAREKKNHEAYTLSHSNTHCNILHTPISNSSSNAHSKTRDTPNTHGSTHVNTRTRPTTTRHPPKEPATQYSQRPPPTP